MTWLHRKWRLLKLKCRAYMLEAQAEHAAELLENHQMRYRILMAELAQVRRHTMALESADVLLRRTA